MSITSLDLCARERRDTGDDGNRPVHAPASLRLRLPGEDTEPAQQSQAARAVARRRAVHEMSFFLGGLRNPVREVLSKPRLPQPLHWEVRPSRPR